MMRIPYGQILLALIITFCLMMVNVAEGATGHKKILAFGDSLTAGYGIPLEKSFPAQLEAKLKAAGTDVTVHNGGVSGDTTSGGLTRLEWLLDQEKPDMVILELGGNDMLRGVDPKVTRENLQKMLEILKSRKLPVLVAGMRSMPNLGILFSDSYARMYKELAKKYDAVYYPFFMDGIFEGQGLLQGDGIHPNEAGVALIVERILPSVKDLLEKK